MTWILQTEALSAGYQKGMLRDLNLTLNRGEILTLIGPNGSGKTTLLKTVARQLKPLSGNILIQEKNMAALTPGELAKQLSVVWTDRIRPERMTCREIVETGRFPYTDLLGRLSKHDQEIVQKSIIMFRAEDVAERYYYEISDGQKQRILLARAFCQQPDIMILDEPTSFLDIRYRQELLSLLRKRARAEGIGVILSLHEVDLAQKISDHVLCIRSDHTIQYGTPENVFRQDIIEELYHLEKESFDPLSGNMEMHRIPGKPEVFVLSAGGSGTPVYRRLQREERPFAAGILYENDVDFRMAKLLASEVVSEKMFRPVRRETLQRALELVHSCEQVIDAGFPVTPWNPEMRRLKEEAQRMGKLLIYNTNFP